MNKNLFKVLLSYIKRYWLLLLLALICALVYVFGMLYTPKLIGETIDIFESSETFNNKTLNSFVVKLLIIVSFSAVFGVLMNVLLNKVAYSTICDLREDAFKKILNVPVKYLDANPHGDVLNRITSDAEAISDGLIQTFAQGFTGIITILATIVIMLTIRWEIALVVIVLTPLSFLVASFLAKRNFKAFKDQSQVKGELSGFMNEMISNQHVVISFNHEDKNVSSFKEINNRLYDIGVVAQFNSALVNPLTRFVNSIVYAIVATSGAILIVYNDFIGFSIGSLTAFLTYASQYTKPFNEISGVASELSNSFASLKRINDLLIEEELHEEDKELKVDIGNVEFKNVSFSYTENKPLIKDLSFKVKSGDKIAIVGPTGCGKTTLINLLMRYYDVSSGDILIDDKSINNYSRESLRNEISMVLQDTWLFKGTILENIKYGNVNATLEEVIEASKKAHAHEFITKLEKGYDTIISDDDGVSIGQKQLLCIARIMLKNSKILILDEATSNIDTRTEVLIGKAFKEAMKNKTSFVIAHRLSTIRDANLILVMKDGNIIEQGTHENLLEQNGFYSELYKSQFEVSN